MMSKERELLARVLGSRTFMQGVALRREIEELLAQPEQTEQDDPNTLRRASLMIHEKYGSKHEVVAHDLLDLASAIDHHDGILPDYYYPVRVLNNTGSGA